MAKSKNVETFAKGDTVFFYVKRHRIWIKGKIVSEKHADEFLNVDGYTIIDNTSFKSRWFVEEGLMTHNFKPGMKVFNC